MDVVFIFHDGRDEYLRATLASFHKNVIFDYKPYKIIIDDTPDRTIDNVNCVNEMMETYGINLALQHHRNIGILASVKEAWERALLNNFDFIFHQENDFTYNEQVDIKTLKKILSTDMNIVQIALRRQPVSRTELARGSVADREYQREITVDGFKLLKTRKLFTFNPSLYHTSIAEAALLDLRLSRHRQPTERLLRGCGQPLSEREIMQHLLYLQPRCYSTFFGSFDSKPVIHHIGEKRCRSTQARK
jgi:hypothetical protein